jgi:hypothetical protein
LRLVDDKQKIVSTAVDRGGGLVDGCSIIGRCWERLCENISRSFESHEIVFAAGTDEIVHHTSGVPISHSSKKEEVDVRNRQDDSCRGGFGGAKRCTLL